MKRTFAVAAASLLALGLSAAPAAADNITGTPDNDRLRGTNGSDFMNGLAGDDRMWGRLGNDYLLGMEGDDTLYAGDRKRTDFEANVGFNGGEGGPGKDRLFGGRGFTYMEGNEGNDRIRGGPFQSGGDDYGRGNEGADLIQLARGQDVAEPDWGADTMKLGGARDYVFIWADGAKDTVWCGTGRDIVEYFGDREDIDVLKGCEQVISGDGKPDEPKGIARIAR